jgi:hypothetical protein
LVHSLGTHLVQFNVKESHALFLIMGLVDRKSIKKPKKKKKEKKKRTMEISGNNDPKVF